MAKDVFHNAVKTALQKQGWVITHDPFPIRFGGVEMYIDLGAEKLIAAQKDGEKIAEELVALGVLKSDIVIGFHSLFNRQFSEYAMG